MKIFVNNNMVKKIVAVKGQDPNTRLFVLEFPFDANLGEIYDVISELKEEVYKNIQEQKAQNESTEQKDQVEPVEQKDESQS